MKKHSNNKKGDVKFYLTISKNNQMAIQKTRILIVQVLLKYFNWDGTDKWP